jgi:hypothetical protein
MNQNHNTIVFYRSWLEALEIMDGESPSYKFIKSIFDYYNEQEVQHDDPMLRLLWSQAAPLLDTLIHNRKVATENGKKGGAKKGNQNARKQPKTTKNNPSQSKTTLDTDTDTDVDTDVRDVDTDIDVRLRRIFEMSDIITELENKDTDEDKIQFSKHILEKLDTLDKNSDEYWRYLPAEKIAIKILEG